MDDSKLEAGTEVNKATTGDPNGAAAAQSDAQANGAEAGTQSQPPNEAANQADIDYAALIADFEVALADERARADKLLDQTQRMAAEYQNSRRRQEAQLGEEIERAVGPRDQASSARDRRL